MRLGEYPSEVDWVPAMMRKQRGKNLLRMLGEGVLPWIDCALSGQ